MSVNPNDNLLASLRTTREVILKQLDDPKLPENKRGILEERLEHINEIIDGKVQELNL
jgi:hypothetical protein